MEVGAFVLPPTRFFLSSSSTTKQQNSNALVKTLQHLAHYAEVQTVIEPTSCFITSDKRKRPDLRLIQPNFHNNECRHDIIVDVTVVHPATESIITTNNTDKRKGWAAHMREGSKGNKYNELALQNNLHFMPIVFESYGRWGKALSLFFETNVVTGWQKKGQQIPLSIMKEYWKKRISVTLQIMNARMFHQRVSRIIGTRPKTLGKPDESTYSDTFTNSWVRKVDCSRI